MREFSVLEWVKNPYFVISGNNLLFANTKGLRFAGLISVDGVTLEQLWGAESGKAISEVLHAGKTGELSFLTDDRRCLVVNIVKIDAERAGLEILEVAAISEKNDVLTPEYYKTIAELAADALLIGSPSGTILWANREAVKLTGYDLEMLVHKRIEFLFTPEVLDAVPMQYEALARGETVKRRRELRRKDGLLVSIEMNTRMLPDGRYMTLVRDISEQTRAMSALRESEKRFELFMNHVPAAIFIKDSAGRTLFANKYLEKLFGWNDSSGKKTDDLLPQDVAQVMMEDDRRALAEGLVHVVEKVQDSKGLVRDFSTIKFALPDLNGDKTLGGIALDVTELRQAVENLERSEDQLRALINAMPDIVCFKDGQGRWVEANDFDVHLFQLEDVDYRGLTDTDLAGMSSFYHDAFLACVESDELAWQRGVISRGEEIIPRPDGNSLVFDVIKVPTFDSNGDRQGLIIVGRDITERVNAEKTLKQSEFLFRSYFEQPLVGIAMIGARQEWLRVNDRFCDIFGYSREQIEKINWQTLLAEPKNPDSEFDILLAQEGMIHLEEIAFCGNNDKTVYADVSAIAVREPDSDYFLIVVVQDVSENRLAREENTSLQNQLNHASKMEAVGTLAGGVAHDFNNLLMAVQGHISLLSFSKVADDPDQEKLREIESLIQSGARLTGQLLGFARGGKYDPRAIDLNEVLRHTAEMFARTRKEIGLVLQLEEGVLVVEADRGQIEQVLMNLLVNAWQAMEHGGTITISSRRKQVGENGEMCVEWSVEDTGSGMDEKTMARIFEPFFTTKDKERGTGLGLASAYGIIKNHGGNIRVSSRPGQGTVFFVELPLTSAEIIAEHESKNEDVKGRGAILLIDDEVSVLDVTGTVLQSLGYTVTMARNGFEALSELENNHQKIDLVLLDMIMPGMNGVEAYSRISERYPSLPVIVTSGYSMNHDVTLLLQSGCRGFIQKPYSIRDLGEKIKSTLYDPGMNQ